MTTSQWNWGWVSPKDTTKKDSNSVIQSGGTIYPYRAATRGQLSATEQKASIDSISTNINQQWSLWRTQVRPILNSLPAGPRDERWRPGIGLPEKIDALTYGVQGTTLFVFNDATATNAYGRYWDETGQRPKTIAEAFEDVWKSISDLDTSTTASTTDVDLEPLWRAVGHRYKDSTLTSLSTSLDSRTGELETNVSQLANDVYGSIGAWGLGVPLNHSVAKNIDRLLKIHNISGGWQNDPSGVSHSGVPAAAHVHPYSEIQPILNSTLTQDRTTGPYVSLENDIKRIRYEIRRTRFGAAGGTWQSDPSDPVSGTTDGSLYQHMSYVGTGTSTSTNPHAITTVETGAETVFTAVRAFTGMSSNADNSPTYSSNNYVVDGTSLETAIGALDSAISTAITTTITRYDTSSDRSLLSETDRQNTPILVTHSIGRIPIVQVLDRTPSQIDYYGQYSSPTYEINIQHVDQNNCYVWTGAAIVDIICIG